MVKILYGVSGEGAGHAIRSKVIIDHLKKEHEVIIAAGGKAYDYLSEYYDDVNKIFALRISYRNNKVSNLNTLMVNLRKFPTARKETWDTIKKIIEDITPDLIISDFEYFTAKAAKKYNLPLISIDNNHIFDNCDIEVPKSDYKDYLTAKMIVKRIVGNADFYLITSFFYPEIKKKNTFLLAPVLREKILSLNPSKKDYILVYQTSDSFKKLFPRLKKIPENFVIYGYDKECRDENLIYKRFNEKEFFNDIENCKAIITNGGFSLITEAIYLKKPILCVPIKRQFEQVCNALYVEKLKYGNYHKMLSIKKIEKFLQKIDGYSENLEKVKNEENERLFDKLDKIIRFLS